MIGTDQSIHEVSIVTGASTKATVSQLSLKALVEIAWNLHCEAVHHSEVPCRVRSSRDQQETIKTVSDH